MNVIAHPLTPEASGEAMVNYARRYPKAARLICRKVGYQVDGSEGEKDDLVLASHTAHILSCIAQAKHSLYEGIGHAPLFEDSERFNRELAEFARQHAG